MMPGWEKAIAKAQELKQLTRGKQTYARIPYDNPGKKCHDCAVKHGQLHVPGCDMERCPRCKGQVFVCGCFAWKKQGTPK